jgi:hypothetical protein
MTSITLTNLDTYDGQQFMQLPGSDYVRTRWVADETYGRVAIYCHSANSRRPIFEELSIDMVGDKCRPNTSEQYPLDWS